MRKLSLFCSFFIMVFSAGFSFAADNKLSAVIDYNSCKLMGDNLYGCTPFECDTALPDEPTNKIHNKIVGLDKDGNCVSEQSNSTGEKVTCRYSQESRKFLSLRMKKFQSDLANMPEASEVEEGILADIFHNECDVAGQTDDKPVVSEDDEAAMSGDEDQAEDDKSDTTPGGETSEAVDPEKTEDNGDLLDENE